MTYWKIILCMCNMGVPVAWCDTNTAYDTYMYNVHYESQEACFIGALQAVAANPKLMNDSHNVLRCKAFMQPTEK